MSQLELETRTLTLGRYPKTSENSTLQAWEAADAFLLNEIAAMELATGPVVILNDTFGALACGLQTYEPLCVSDSYLSQLATRHNLSLNGFAPESVVLQDSLTALPDAPSLVVIKVPKTLAMLEHQLHMLRLVVAPHTQIIAGAKARDIDGKMVDLGCGNGIVGLVALAQNPSALISFIDESHMALASSRMDVEINCPQDLPRASFVVNDSLANIAPDSLQAVLCNPPFHQQQTITDHLAWNMFSDARRCLAHGGELRIVGNRHLNYYPKLKHLFGNCEQLAGNNKFVVLRAVKLASSR